jgi:predicted tellurium resistance membrane protein TerC
MELFTSTEAWMSLLMLTGMEIVLGIDNIIFISIVTSRLPKSEEAKARNTGIFMALFIRIALLSLLGYLRTLTSDVLTIFGEGLSWRDIIMLAGGLFLVVKSTTEIYNKVEDREHDDEMAAKKTSFSSVVMQVIVLDIVFSFDSIVTAIAIGSHIQVMIAAVILSMIVMITFAGKISAFINKHPSMKMLALSFLLMIGFLLILDGFEKGINKNYLYFAMAFSFAVELLNIRAHRKKTS